MSKRIGGEWRYAECSATTVPTDVEWSLPPGRQGETLEVAFGQSPRGPVQAVSGVKLAPWWKRVTDLSIAVGEPGRVVFHRLTTREPASILADGESARAGAPFPGHDVARGALAEGPNGVAIGRPALAPGPVALSGAGGAAEGGAS